MKGYNRFYRLRLISHKNRSVPCCLVRLDSWTWVQTHTCIFKIRYGGRKSEVEITFERQVPASRFQPLTPHYRPCLDLGMSLRTLLNSVPLQKFKMAAIKPDVEIACGLKRPTQKSKWDWIYAKRMFWLSSPFNMASKTGSAMIFININAFRDV